MHPLKITFQSLKVTHKFASEFYVFRLFNVEWFFDLGMNTYFPGHSFSFALFKRPGHFKHKSESTAKKAASRKINSNIVSLMLLLGCWMCVKQGRSKEKRSSDRRLIINELTNLFRSVPVICLRTGTVKFIHLNEH